MAMASYLQSHMLSKLEEQDILDTALEVRKNSSNEYRRYDTKQLAGEISVILEFWGLSNTPSLPSLLGPLWPVVIGSDRVLSMGQI